MKIIIDRVYKYPKYTVGEVYVNGNFYCYSMEDTDRGLHVDMPMRYLRERKVYGETAIPCGTYEVIIDYSPKFKKYMPHVLFRNDEDKLVEVPCFSGIRIHCGNTDKDTLGCLMFGDWQGAATLVKSKPITSNLIDAIQKARNKKEKVILEIH